MKTLTHSLFLGGLGAVVFGCWLIYHPLGFIIGGLLLIAFALILEKHQQNESR